MAILKKCIAAGRICLFGNSVNRYLEEIFQEFIRMIKGQDYMRQQEMLNLSLEISRLVTRASQEEGVAFDND